MPIHLLKRLAVGLTLWALLVPLGEAGLNVVPDLGGSAARAAEQQECSFPITRARELAFREITERHHISCAEAKRVLRKLRGNRDMIPMSCVRTFRRQGWLIQNSNADHVSVSARYWHRSQWFTYSRPQPIDDPWCKRPSRRAHGYNDS